MTPIHYLKILTIVLLQTSTSTYSCESIEDLEEDIVHYKIKKGTHKSGFGYIEFKGDMLEFEVTFDSTAKYETKIPANQGDINKLYGFTDCNEQITPHNHSARFGWRWYYDDLQLFAYCYTNAQRSSKFLKSISIKTAYKCAIEITDSSYIFIINDRKYHEEKRGCTKIDTEKHLLFPYFGGDELAPHDISIFIKQL